MFTLLLTLLFTTPAHADEAKPAPQAVQAQTASQVTATLVLKVAKRDEAADALVKKTQALGGYFSTLASAQVVLRVPVDHTEELLATARGLGLVVSKTYQRTDQSAALGDLRSRLGARQDVLKRYLEVLGAAHADAVVTVEQQVTSLIAEIEGLQGQIRMMENQVDYATVTVAFQFRERAAPRVDGSSSFAWLNTVNLSDLISGFRAGSRGPRLKGVVARAPEGFAAYDKARPFRAVSPDGLMYQVRTMPHEPEATLFFWKEALKKRMIDAGYTWLADVDLQDGSVPGYLCELAAPMGPEDDVYWVAVFPHGDQLVIVEAAGEAARFHAKEAAIKAAIEALKL